MVWALKYNLQYFMAFWSVFGWFLLFLVSQIQLRGKCRVFVAIFLSYFVKFLCHKIYVEGRNMFFWVVCGLAGLEHIACRCFQTFKVNKTIQGIISKLP